MRLKERGMGLMLVVIAIAFLIAMVSVNALMILRKGYLFNIYYYLMTQAPYTSESAIVEVVNSKNDSAYLELYSVDFYTGGVVYDSQHYVGKFNWDPSGASLTSRTYYRNLALNLVLKFGWKDDAFTEWYPEELARVYGW